MVLAQLRSSVSTQAICFYWERRPMVCQPSAVLLQFLPPRVTYIRRLTTAELRQQGVVALTNTAWYGCFAYHTYTQLARCESYEQLRAFIQQYDYLLLEIDDI